jgi:hypothetical protein
MTIVCLCGCPDDAHTRLNGVCQYEEHECLPVTAHVLRSVQRRERVLHAKISILSDAAFHFQTCKRHTCESCEWFSRYLCGETQDWETQP